MYSWAILLGLFYLAPMLFANEEKARIIFGARCSARCFAKSQVCSGTCIQACNTPCRDSNFYRVKSCTAHCKKWVTNNILTRECKSSCKWLLNLYNTGGGKSKDKTKHLMDKLPDRPTSVNSTLLVSKKKNKMLISWSYNRTKTAVFILESRYFKEEPFYLSEWEFVQTANVTSIEINPRTAAWSEYRVMSVNEHGTSDYSSPSTPVHVMPDRPSPPRHFRILKMVRRKDKVSVTLAWSKPLLSELPVHRYRIFWSHRLDMHTKKLHSLRVHHHKIRGDTHSFTVDGLSMNTTYVFELQAICHFKNKRLRSKRVFLMRRTLDKEPEQSLKLTVQDKEEDKNKVKRKVPTTTKVPTQVKRKVKTTAKVPTQGQITIQGHTYTGNRVHSNRARSNRSWMWLILIMVVINTYLTKTFE